MNTTKTAAKKLTVTYWAGTRKVSEGCNTYAQAMLIAAKNSNAYSPRFEDAEGHELHDDGNGLAYQDESGKWVYVA